jgi:hypothetical protein
VIRSRPGPFCASIPPGCHPTAVRRPRPGRSGPVRDGCTISPLVTCRSCVTWAFLAVSRPCHHDQSQIRCISSRGLGREQAACPCRRAHHAEPLSTTTTGEPRTAEFPRAVLVHIRTSTNGRLGHADLIYCMNLTLDGYIAAVGDGIGWSGLPAEPRAVSVVARPRAGERACRCTGASCGRR